MCVCGIYLDFYHIYLHRHFHFQSLRWMCVSQTLHKLSKKWKNIFISYRIFILLSTFAKAMSSPAPQHTFFPVKNKKIFLFYVVCLCCYQLLHKLCPHLLPQHILFFPQHISVFKKTICSGWVLCACGVCVCGVCVVRVCVCVVCMWCVCYKENILQRTHSIENTFYRGQIL